jgi:hypothetical protein
VTKSPLAVAFILLAALIAFPQGAQAVDKPNILIMADDADTDTVPRHSRVFKRVLDAIAGELHTEGFDVFDEVAVTLDDFAQDRSRRSDAEVIDIANSVTRPPIDIVVLFSIYASAEELKHTMKVKARISGRLLNTKSGQRLENFRGRFSEKLDRAGRLSTRVPAGGGWQIQSHPCQGPRRRVGDQVG